MVSVMDWWAAKTFAEHYLRVIIKMALKFLYRAEDASTQGDLHQENVQG